MPNSTTINKRYVLIGAFVLVIIGIPLLSLIYKQFAPTQESTEDQEKPSLQLSCPSSPQFCNSGQAIFDESNKYLGFGGNLEKDSPILASIDGKVTSFDSLIGDETINTIYIDNAEKQIRAVYMFKGQTFVGEEVKVGDLMGKTESPLTKFKTGLLFLIVQGDEVTGEKPVLNHSNFIF